MHKNNLITFYKLKKYSFQNNFSAGPEVYFDRPCIGYIKKGHAKFLYNGKTFYANSGSLIYISLHTRYQSIWYGYPDIEWYVINFDFRSKHSFSNYGFQILKNFSENLFEKMIDSYENAPFISISYFYQLLDDIYKKMKVSAITSSYLTIKPAIDYLENNYKQAISIEELAKYCNLSRSAFFKIFKKTTKVTPIEYKHNIMIQHAIDLISNTDMSIEEISSSVGFPSSNYFRKVFFKFTEKTPKELRKNQVWLYVKDGV